jgi:GNAT superfamily N-acetyltransferase
MKIRPFVPTDLAPVVELLNRTLHADQITPETFVRKVLLDQNFDPAGALVAEEAGVVGFALGIVRKHLIEDQTPDFDRGYLTLIAVAPEFQRKGTGTELLKRLYAYYQAGGAKSVWVSPYSPNYFTPGVDVDAYPGAVEFFAKNRFAEAYRPLSMDASLLGLAAPEWVKEKEQSLAADGVSIVPFEVELALPLIEFARRKFPGDWQRYIRESIASIMLGRCRSDHLWVAHSKGQVLGFARHEGERFGPFGVSPTERGRGIGAVLLFKVLEVMKANGLHNAWLLWTDDKTARLYAEAGFKQTRRYVVMTKTVE